MIQKMVIFLKMMMKLLIKCQNIFKEESKVLHGHIIKENFYNKNIVNNL